MLKRIYENGEKIDAMVLTHFDQDHIMGMLAGLQKAQKKNCIPEIEALYFNTGEGYWKHHRIEKEYVIFPEETVKVSVRPGVPGPYQIQQNYIQEVHHVS